jgi:hypothetical protein
MLQLLCDWSKRYRGFASTYLLRHLLQVIVLVVVVVVVLVVVVVFVSDAKMSLHDLSTFPISAEIGYINTCSQTSSSVNSL